MMNKELNFSVTGNDFENVLICWWVTLFLRVTYWYSKFIWLDRVQLEEHLGIFIVAILLVIY